MSKFQMIDLFISLHVTDIILPNNFQSKFTLNTDFFQTKHKDNKNHSVSESKPESKSGLTDQIFDALYHDAANNCTNSCPALQAPPELFQLTPSDPQLKTPVLELYTPATPI